MQPRLCWKRRKSLISQPLSLLIHSVFVCVWNTGNYTAVTNSWLTMQFAVVVMFSSLRNLRAFSHRSLKSSFSWRCVQFDWWVVRSMQGEALLHFASSWRIDDAVIQPLQNVPRSARLMWTSRPRHVTQSTLHRLHRMASCAYHS